MEGLHRDNDEGEVLESKIRKLMIKMVTSSSGVRDSVAQPTATPPIG